MEQWIRKEAEEQGEEELRRRIGPGGEYAYVNKTSWISRQPGQAPLKLDLIDYKGTLECQSPSGYVYRPSRGGEDGREVREVCPYPLWYQARSAVMGARVQQQNEVMGFRAGDFQSLHILESCARAGCNRTWGRLFQSRDRLRAELV